MNKHAKTERAKAIRKLDTALSILIRAGQSTCASCGRITTELDAGHFRRRECMATRFDYRNLRAQCRKCNRFEGGRPYELGLAIDEAWGKGTAQKLFQLSKTIKQWELDELEQLESAAKHSFLAYRMVYDQLVG